MTRAAEIEAAARAIERAIIERSLSRKGVVETVSTIAAIITTHLSAAGDAGARWWCCSADYPNHDATCKNAATTAPADAAGEPSTAGEAWKAWFHQVGEHGLANVVNATATLVIAERGLEAERVRSLIVGRLHQMRDEHKAAGTYPQGNGVFARIAAEVESMSLDREDVE